MRRRLFFIALVSFVLLPLHADESALPPDHGFPAARYEKLWTRSPFAVASAEDGPVSPDYAMVGAAEIEGVSYINLIEKHSGNHFLLASDAPSHGLTLVSVVRGKDAAATYAIVDRGGQSLRLRFEQVSPMAPVPPPPGIVAGPIPAQNPGAESPAPGSVFQAPVAVLPNVSANSPPAHFHHKIIRIPPLPGQNAPPAHP